MKPKIKYDVNVLGMKNKKSMMKTFFPFNAQIRYLKSFKNFATLHLGWVSQADTHSACLHQLKLL